MKSIISTGLVAALLLPSAVNAGGCPKHNRGSNRITCHMFVDESHVSKGGKKGGLFGFGGSKKKGLEIKRRTTTFAWSFFWNYIASDDCPKTHAHFTSLLPPLSHLPHAVKCRVEVRWHPDKDHGQCDYYGNQIENHDNKHPHTHWLYDPYDERNCNVTWDFAGESFIDHLSLPGKMVWPLQASYHRPDHHFKSNDFHIHHELANEGDQFKLEIHSGKANDFSHSWGTPVGGHIGWHPEHRKKEEDDKDKKDKKKDKKEKSVPEIKKDHAKFHGYYNTKSLYSCWVFDKFHVVTHDHIRTGKKKDKRADEGELLTPEDHHQVEQLLREGLHHFHTHLPAWSTCEPRPPVPCTEEHHEDKCDGDSCKVEDKCEGDSCKVGDKCEGDSCKFGSDNESGSDSGSDSDE